MEIPTRNASKPYEVLMEIPTRNASKPYEVLRSICVLRSASTGSSLSEVSSSLERSWNSQFGFEAICAPMWLFR